MKISTKGRYALRLMIDLAENQKDGFIPLKDIAARQGISKKYLEQIVPILNQKNFLKTVRGYQGGYRLLHEPNEYTLGDILRATEKALTTIQIEESGTEECLKIEHCLNNQVWEGLYQSINQYLDQYTLQDILQHKNNLHYDYVI